MHTCFRLLNLLLIAAAVRLVAAQTPDPDAGPVTRPVGYGEQVSETISATAIWDWWQIEGVGGDQLYVEMTGYNGLEPLLGLLDSNGTLISRSADGAVNDIVDLEFTLPESGLYTIVATRTGNQQGTSTGTYDLRVTLLNPAAVRDNPYAEVTFRCGDDEVTNAIDLTFAARPDVEQRIRVYGLDGFRPLVRLAGANPDEQPACSAAGVGVGDVLTLPDAPPLTLDETNAAVVDLVIPEAMRDRILTVTVGSIDGAPGRYVVFITGFTLTEPRAAGFVAVQQGPLAAATAGASVYVIRTENSRLDPSVGLSGETERCDDAGRRGCDHLPSLNGAGVTTADGLRVTGSRFDAGASLPAGLLDEVTVEITSFNQITSGDYTLMIVGSL